MTAETVVSILGLYLLVGLVFAVAFVILGLERVDPMARRAPWRVRAVLVPGAMALWPVMAVKWVMAPKVEAD